MSVFNLIESPWIPVRWLANTNSAAALVSLHDAFTRCAEIADLDCAPPERISLTRLLICITHAALGAPEDSDGWDGFDTDLEAKVATYLRSPEIYPHFNLLGDGQRFLQEDLPVSADPVRTSKLFANLATGNNPTIIDHSGMTASRDFPAASVALGLLTFQNFYPVYGAGYKGRGPCSNGNSIHCLLMGACLRSFICLNLLDKQSVRSLTPKGMGRPIWECSTPAELNKSTQTFLGRLVPRHRSLRVRDDLSFFDHQKNSLLYPGWEPHREHTTSIIIDKKNQRRILPARLERAIWRDLHCITALRAGTSGAELNNHAAPVLASHEEQLVNRNAQLWTGALITDLKAKILDTVESAFTISWELFCDSGRSIYSAGVDFAESLSKRLYGAIKTYYSLQKREQPPIGEGQQYFWHALDQQYRELIALAADPESRRGEPSFGDTEATDEWTRLVRRAVQDAYDSVCPRTTPRQLQAYAAGLKILKKRSRGTKQAKKVTKQPKIKAAQPNPKV